MSSYKVSNGKKGRNRNLLVQRTKAKFHFSTSKRQNKLVGVFGLAWMGTCLTVAYLANVGLIN